jgi:hypothetical protein
VVSIGRVRDVKPLRGLTFGALLMTMVVLIIRTVFQIGLKSFWRRRMSKIFKKEFLTEDDVIRPIQNTIHDAIRERTKKFDELVFEVFSKYGYSKDWILDPANRDRISVICIGGNYLFRVDNRDLFLLKENWTIEEDNITTTYDIEPLAPFSEEVVNNA